MKPEFRYPVNNSEICNVRYARDFLRDTWKYQQRTDPRYLCNQRDSANFFIDWFLSDRGISYRGMLSRQHQLAALGNSGENTYEIFFLKYQRLIPNLVSQSHISYISPCNRYTRDTYPGLYRNDLESRGIDHPAIDRFRLSCNEFEMLKSCKGATGCRSLEWVAGRGPVICHRGKFKFSVRFRNPNAVCLVSLCSRHGFVRSAPIGRTRDALFSSCAAQMTKIKELYHQGYSSELLHSSWAYYHAAINLMPFSNINNSIFMAQVNSLRRLCGLSGIVHRRMDLLAMISSPAAFLEVIGRVPASGTRPSKIE